MFPLKTFYWGQKGARDNFSLQIRNIVENGYRSLGELPVIIGECGIPMDMKYVRCFLCAFPCIKISFFLIAKVKRLKRMILYGRLG